MDGQGGRIVLGMGCRRGSDPENAMALAVRLIADGGCVASDVKALATIEGREAEPALRFVAETLNVPLLAFSAARLEAETPRLATPSEVVFRETGCHGVAEAAALAALGTKARLLITKQIANGVTAALACVDEIRDE